MEYDALEKLFSYKQNGVSDRYSESINDKKVLSIKFQTGPTGTNEKNGIFIEDLLIIAVAKLEEYNKHLSSRENSLAITKIEEAILWLTCRKQERQYRGVYGTEIK